MPPAERSALHVLSRGQDPPMPPVAPDGERPEAGPGQRELIARLDAPAAITDETWTLMSRRAALPVRPPHRLGAVQRSDRGAPGNRARGPRAVEPARDRPPTAALRHPGQAPAGRGRGRHADDLAVAPDMAHGRLAARGPATARRVRARRLCSRSATAVICPSAQAAFRAMLGRALTGTHRASGATPGAPGQR
jgi:hypothetical protein